MIYIAALILLVYAAVAVFVLALCKTAAQGDRQRVYEPPRDKDARP